MQDLRKVHVVHFTGGTGGTVTSRMKYMILYTGARRTEIYIYIYISRHRAPAVYMTRWARSRSPNYMNTLSHARQTKNLIGTWNDFYRSVDHDELSTLMQQNQS